VHTDKSTVPSGRKGDLVDSRDTGRKGSLPARLSKLYFTMKLVAGIGVERYSE